MDDDAAREIASLTRRIEAVERVNEIFIDSMNAENDVIMAATVFVNALARANVPFVEGNGELHDCFVDLQDALKREAIAKEAIIQEMLAGNPKEE